MNEPYQIHMFCVFCGEPLTAGNWQFSDKPVCRECLSQDMVIEGDDVCASDMGHTWDYREELGINVCVVCGVIDD